MPVQTADKVIALSRDFRSQRRLAELLGVSPAQVTRWRNGRGIDAANAQRVDLLELAMSSLLRVYSPAAAEDWLLGVNPLTVCVKLPLWSSWTLIRQGALWLPHATCGV